MSETLILKAQNNLHSLVSIAFNYTDKERAVVVYDTDCLLSTLLMQGYKRALPNALLIDFNASAPEEILTIFDSLHPFDLVILIQSKSFRLNEFRLRVELFKKQIKVIEHPHLSRMSDDEAEYYIDSLAYDADYYRGVGRGLKAKIDAAPMGIIDSGGELLIYDTPFEPAKLNIGDYSDMPNTGGQFPLGEVFTEAQDLRALYGRAKIFCFGDVTYKLNTPATPITIIVEEGQVIACENSTPAFDEILFNIRRDEGTVWIRELGLGLNRAFDKIRTVADTGTYERMCGVHLSLGAKHGIYGKPGFKRRDGKYHVDIFVDTDTFTLGDEIVYQGGAWIV
ncbi:MAG: hypothetical protein WC691_07025 [Sulfuricurvum sp.]|jgi:hypothetical protein